MKQKFLIIFLASLLSVAAVQHYDLDTHAVVALSSACAYMALFMLARTTIGDMIASNIQDIKDKINTIYLEKDQHEQELADLKQREKKTTQAVSETIRQIDQDVQGIKDKHALELERFKTRMENISLRSAHYKKNEYNNEIKDYIVHSSIKKATQTLQQQRDSGQKKANDKIQQEISSMFDAMNTAISKQSKS